VSARTHDTAPSRRDIAVERSITKARARAEERSTLLIDAALDLVAERKSLEFTVQEVVDRTKLSLHAFYQLFESKDALVEAVLEESLERGVLELRRRVDEAERPIGRLRAFIVGYFELATESRQPVFGAGAAFTQFSVHLDLVAPAKAWDAYRPLRGSVRADLDPDLVAAFLLASVRTVTEITIAGTSSARPTGEQLWRLVADGVTPLDRGSGADHGVETGRR
jgi:AcrR family transcriptional regulator